MIVVRSARHRTASPFGYIPPPPTRTETQSSTEVSNTGAILIGGSLVLVFGLIIGLQFYKASKGIQDTYVMSGHDHHGGLNIGFGGGHHGHGGLTFSLNKRGRRRRSRRRCRR